MAESSSKMEGGESNLLDFGTTNDNAESNGTINQPVEEEKKVDSPLKAEEKTTEVATLTTAAESPEQIDLLDMTAFNEAPSAPLSEPTTDAVNEDAVRLKAEEEAAAAAAAAAAEAAAKKKAQEEEDARVAAEQEAATRLKAEEDARIAAEKESARLKAEEAARIAAEEEAARVKAEEAARIAAEKEKEEARIAAEKEEADRKKAEEAADQEAARLKAEEEARTAEQEAARLKAEEDARIAAENEKEEARIAAEKEEAARKKTEEEEEAARIAAENTDKIEHTSSETANLKPEGEVTRPTGETVVQLPASDETRTTSSISKAATVVQIPKRNSMPENPSSSTGTVVQIPTDTVQPQQQQQDNANCENDVLLIELNCSLQSQMSQKAEAENRARRAEERVKECEALLKNMSNLKDEVDLLQAYVKEQEMEKAEIMDELKKQIEEKESHERKVIVLTSRVNAAKKKEANKGNLAEHLEDENKNLQKQLSTSQEELKEVTGAKERLEAEIQTLKGTAVGRVKSAEQELIEERRLNEERKKKMKLFVETKAEELREAKDRNDELEVEIEQTQMSLRETNNRWKQLHAQWVQSQTRNRELQRELNRFKKDSDHLHKVGDSLEMQLKNSAQETEEHKNKRLTAKHELMTVLQTLEAERKVSSSLRDSIKFTFTPKALSQQQLLQESLQDFEAELMKLSRRLGKQLPPSTGDVDMYSDNPSSTASSASDSDVVGEGDDDGSDGLINGSAGGGKRNRSQIDSTHLLNNLEKETQSVSKCIMALISDIERMRLLLDGDDRSCVSTITDILSGHATLQPSASVHGDSNAQMRLGISKYGKVSEHSSDMEML